MTPIVEQLSLDEIMNEDLIKKIQESINVQYPQYSSKQKAGKLAANVHEIIERSLPNFSIDAKKSVRNLLLTRNVTSTSLTINSQDIVDTSIEVVETDELEAQLVVWLQSKVDIEIHNLERYVQTLLESRMTELAEVMREETVEVGSIELIETPQDDNINTNTAPQIKRNYIIAAISALIIMIPVIHGVEKAYYANSELKSEEIDSSDSIILSPNALPSDLQYETIDEENLRLWLNKRDSTLADEPYFSTIIEVAQSFNLHPFLLFAVTGQEQGFVPRTNPKATEIANNPFNVFHSWEDYNTTIADSTQIAARTIVNLSEGRPDDVHPIQWINRKYAEDPNWWVGVSSIFEKLDIEVQ